MQESDFNKLPIKKIDLDSVIKWVCIVFLSVAFGYAWCWIALNQ